MPEAKDSLGMASGLGRRELASAVENFEDFSVELFPAIDFICNLTSATQQSCLPSTLIIIVGQRLCLHTQIRIRTHHTLVRWFS